METHHVVDSHGNRSKVVNSDWLWILVFALLVCVPCFAERLHTQSKRLKSIEERLDRLEQQGLSRATREE